jgi:hypothetical protein
MQSAARLVAGIARQNTLAGLSSAFADRAITFIGKANRALAV